MKILIYQDYRGNNFALYRSLCVLFGKEFVGYVDERDIIDNDILDSSVKIFIIPGGEDLFYCERLNGKGIDKIKSYILSGGVYLGICGGAYFGASYVLWAQNDESEKIIGKRDLALFNGKAEGPVYEFIENNCLRKSHLNLVKILYYIDDQIKEALTVYLGGPVFIPYIKDSNTYVIARYDDLPNKPIAILGCNYGKGKAVLCSPHLEITSYDLEQSIYQQKNPSFAYSMSILEKYKSLEMEKYKVWKYILQLCIGEKIFPSQILEK